MQPKLQVYVRSAQESSTSSVKHDSEPSYTIYITVIFGLNVFI